MSVTRRTLGWSVLGLATALVLGGCSEDPAGLGGGPQVSIQFASAGSAASANLLSTQAAAGTPGQIEVQGSNGTLTITDVRMIVAEFELKRADVNCDDAVNEDECEEFEAGPYFLDLPLNGGTTQVVRQEVPAGTYSKVEFEVEDVEADEDDDSAKAQQIQQLLSSIRAEFADWPGEASLLVIGTFTPTGGAPVDFMAYFKAEIEIEMDFEPPFVIGEADPDKAVMIGLDPAAWFTRLDGTVVDLSQYNGQLVEFDADLEKGFTDIEIEDEH